MKPFFKLKIAAPSFIFMESCVFLISANDQLRKLFLTQGITYTYDYSHLTGNFINSLFLALFIMH